MRDNVYNHAMIAIWRNVLLSFCITHNWLGDLLITQTELSRGCWQCIIMQIWLFLSHCLFCLTLVLLRGWIARQGSAFMHIHWTHCWILTATFFISTWMHYWQPKAAYHDYNVAVFQRIWIYSNFLALISLLPLLISCVWCCVFQTGKEYTKGSLMHDLPG